jgi:hypothetical protein
VLIASAFALILSWSLSTPALATTTFSQDYGTFTGATVNFQDVTESSTTSPSALFGGPSVSGNSLEFSPSAFGAYGAYGASQYTNSTLNMLITGTGQNAINQIILSEYGDYTLVGSHGTGATNASIVAPLTVTVYQVDGVTITPFVFSTTNMDFTPSGGVFSLPGQKGSGVGWQGTVTLDVTGLLRDNGYQGYATEVALTWENDLTANSQAGTISYIESKEAGGTGITIVSPGVVPEPVTLLGVLIGLSGLASYVRRRTRSVG